MQHSKVNIICSDWWQLFLIQGCLEGPDVPPKLQTQLFIRSQTASAHLGACPHSGYRGAWRTTGSLSPGTDHMWKTKGNRLTESFIFGSCCYFICCWKQHKMFRLTSGHEHRRNLIVTNPAIYGALFCRRPWSEEGWMNSYSDIAFC